MSMKQLSVFLENREGRIERVTEILKDADVNIICFSLADTLEYGVLRMLVSEPEKAKLHLKEQEFSTNLTNVLVVNLMNQVGRLHEMVSLLLKHDISVEYMYAAANMVLPSVVIKVTQTEEAEQLLREAGYTLY